MLLLDPIASLQDDDEALPEDDKATFLLEELVMAGSDPPSVLRLLLLATTFLLEEDETILPSLDPFDFADVPLQDDILNNVLMSIRLSFHFPQ